MEARTLEIPLWLEGTNWKMCWFSLISILQWWDLVLRSWRSTRVALISNLDLLHNRFQFNHSCCDNSLLSIRYSFLRLRWVLRSLTGSVITLFLLLPCGMCIHCLCAYVWRWHFWLYVSYILNWNTSSPAYGWLTVLILN